MKWDKKKLLMVVNAVGLVCMLGVISTALILEFVLPPRSGRIEGAMGGGRMISLYFGLTRHEWGHVHFYIGNAFLILTLVHILLNWRWIACVAWNPPGEPGILWKRRALTTLIVCFMLICLLFPWIGKKETLPRYEVLKSRTAGMS